MPNKLIYYSFNGKKEKIRIVISGWIHWNLEKVYSEILKNNKEKKIDLIICIGDFEC